MGRRSIVLAMAALVALAGCTVKDRVIKDLAIEEMDQLNEHYMGKTAWTRALLIDIGPEGFIDRDVKVKIVGLDLHWQGAVTVQGPNRRRLTHALDLERPLTKAAFEEKMNRFFWFKHPDYRYRMNLRKYGKKTAKAVYNHELFKGMKREAALESWGFPDEMNSTDVGGRLQEQWIYRDPRQKGKKRYIYITDALVDSWEE
jgi:hypothetical protein